MLKCNQELVDDDVIVHRDADRGQLTITGSDEQKVREVEGTLNDILDKCIQQCPVSRFDVIQHVEAIISVMFYDKNEAYTCEL